MSATNWDELIEEVQDILAEAQARIDHKNRPEFPPHSTRITRYNRVLRKRPFGV